MTAAGLNHYYWLTSLLAARGLQTRTCRVIAALNAVLGMVPALLILSPAGPHGPVRQAIAIAIGVFALGTGAMWLRHSWPSQRFSAVSVHHTLMDLIARLQQGDIVLIHGAWQWTFDRAPLLPLLGGMPHTMLLIGYDGNTSQWLLLNPDDPFYRKNDETGIPKIFKMSTKKLMDFWGRRFLFYPPRFALTTITLDP